MMNDSDISNLLQSITDDHAFDSDFGGDSDADDHLAVTVNSTDQSSTRNSTSNSSFNTPSMQHLTSHSNLSEQSIKQASSSQSSRLRHPVRAKLVFTDHSSSEKIDSFEKCNEHSPVLHPPVSSDNSLSHESPSSPTGFSQQQNSTCDFQWSKTGKKPTKFTMYKFKEKYGFNVNLDNSNVLNYFLILHF